MAITILIIIAAGTAIYLYATLAFYYGFKNWYPVCGCSKQRSTQAMCGNETMSPQELASKMKAEDL